ncbi:DUF2637 domain-containing protein [Sphaerisporangium aureirubrum]|uniref:DUF2637 domain-containing protein n=1 Tax=Sphaerisporangium aureirubrum TaxID=1544736 RepID=A0ABW1NKY6_9ACTN
MEALLIPLAVDGAIVVASMSILLSSRYGSRGGALAWIMLVAGSLASLGANIAVAEPTVIGKIIAAWPSAALIGSYELLMSQIRRIATNDEPVAISSEDCDSGPAELTHQAENAGAPSVVAVRVRLRNQQIASLHRAAWRWAQANRTPDGALPSGTVIAHQFARSARWGRWIKRSGVAGDLG